MARLPPARTSPEFRALGRGDAGVRAGAEALWRRLGIGAGELVLFETGSLPVFAAGAEHVLKLYPQFYAHGADQERSALEGVERALPVATPRVVASGEADGWRYLVMDRLPGTPLDRVWPSLPPGDHLRLAEQAGRLLAGLHAVDGRDLAILRPDWQGFVREQSARCVERQRGLGAPAWWLEQIPAFLEAAGLEVGAAPVFLHTEIMGQHLLVERGPSGWALSGLIDFEPAMMGAAAYEFASVGLFLTRGDAPALRALLRAYGWRDADLALGLQRRFLAYALLHRYSNLRWYLDERPPPPGTETLDGLAAWWWALP